MEIFETGQILLSTLGYPLFDPVAKPAVNPSNANELFFCKTSGVNGRGLYTQEGFVVLTGSTGRRETLPSSVGTAGGRLRIRLVDAGAMREEGDTVVFQKDHLFRSPSMAALALTGRASNGWLEWRTKDGKTLDAVKRQETT